MARKKENLNNLSRTELAKKLTGFQNDLRNLRFKAEGARSKNVKEVKNLRKTIARVMTALNQSKAGK